MFGSNKGNVSINGVKDGEKTEKLNKAVFKERVYGIKEGVKGFVKNMAFFTVFGASNVMADIQNSVSDIVDEKTQEINLPLNPETGYSHVYFKLQGLNSGDEIDKILYVTPKGNIDITSTVDSEKLKKGIADFGGLDVNSMGEKIEFKVITKKGIVTNVDVSKSFDTEVKDNTAGEDQVNILVEDAQNYVIFLSGDDKLESLVIDGGTTPLSDVTILYGNGADISDRFKEIIENGKIKYVYNTDFDVHVNEYNGREENNMITVVPKNNKKTDLVDKSYNILFSSKSDTQVEEESNLIKKYATDELDYRILLLEQFLFDKTDISLIREFFVSIIKEDISEMDISKFIKENSIIAHDNVSVFKKLEANNLTEESNNNQELLNQELLNQELSNNNQEQYNSKKSLKQALTYAEKLNNSKNALLSTEKKSLQTGSDFFKNLEVLDFI